MGLMWIDMWKFNLSVCQYQGVLYGSGRLADGPGKLARVTIIKLLKEKEKGIMTMSSQHEDVINKPEAKVRFRVF